jgi:hypothetical protein
MPPEHAQEPPEKCGVDRLIDLLEQDIDLALLEQARSRTPTERIRWLEEMQDFAARSAAGRVTR